MVRRRLSSWALLGASACLAGPLAAQLQTLQTFGPGVATDYDNTGYSLSILGDLNGDGIDDWIVGAPGDSTNGTDGGSAYVLRGGASPSILYQLHGSAGDATGLAVASAGDIDHDGRGDFIVAMPGHTELFPLVLQDNGEVTAYSGKTGAIKWVVYGPKNHAHLGLALAGGQDANGDGWPDVLIGAPDWDIDPATSQFTNEGYAELRSGKDGTLLRTYSGAASDQLGAAVAFVGDVDGDGGADYAIASPGHDYIMNGPFPLLVTDGGRVQVYSGKTGALIFQKLGGSNDFLGSSVCGVGDTDGDGVPEILIGAQGHLSGTGIAYLYEGAAGTLIHSFNATGTQNPGYFGSSVAPLGDIDKDGRPDFAIGEPGGLFSGTAGLVVVYSGKTLSPYVPNIPGGASADECGYTLSPTPGDINGDGWPDLLTSWPNNDAQGQDAGVAVAYSFLTYQNSLGFGGPGAAKLEMYGTPLASGGQADLRLSGAAANSPAFLLASALQGFAPFKGGVLVPNVAAGLLLPMATDAQGKLVIPGVPGGEGYLIVYCQFVIKDLSQPKGWALSNALGLQMLP